MKNVMSLTVLQAARRILALVLFVAIERALGAAIVGRYQFVLAYLTLVLLATDPGVSNYMLREMARDPREIRQWVFDLLAFRLAMLAAIGAAATAVLFALDNRGEAMPVYFWFLIAFAFMGLSETLRTVFNSQQKMEHGAALETLRIALAVGASLWAIHRGYGLIVVAQLHAIAAAIGLALWIVDYFICYERPRYRAEPRAWAARIRKSIPFLPYNLLAVIQVQITIVILGLLSFETEVGYFSKASKIVVVLFILPGVIAAAAFPALSRMAAESMNRLREAVRLLISWIEAAAIPIVVGGWILAAPLLGGIYDAAEPETIVAFHVLLLSLPLVFVVLILDVALKAAGHERIVLRSTAISAAVCIALNLALVGWLKSYGAALAFLTAKFVMWSILGWNAARILRAVPSLRSRLAILASTILMAIVIALPLVAALNVYVRVAIGATMYGLGLLGTGFLRREGLKRLGL